MTDANRKGIYIGRTDFPLSDEGSAELASKSETLTYPKVHRVYSSPLCRCKETADILFPEIEMTEVEDLTEADLGEFEGKSAGELIDSEDYKKWIKSGEAPPDGESIQEITARVYKALHRIITDMMESGITHSAVITHAGIIKTMLMGFGIPKYDLAGYSIEYGEGFDVITDARMWLNEQAFEILGVCPY